MSQCGLILASELIPFVGARACCEVAMRLQAQDAEC
jgi:hypothetical protein